jgi:hypothetical protein
MTTNYLADGNPEYGRDYYPGQPFRPSNLAQNTYIYAFYSDFASKPMMNPYQ